MFERDVEKFGFVISQFKITSKTIMGNILGRSTNSYHVLVTGKGNCGKTSVIASLCGVTYVESSKGVERTSMVHENDRYFSREHYKQTHTHTNTHRFTWLDFGENITSASISTHIKNIDAIVYVVDASSKRSIASSGKMFRSLLALDSLSDVPVLIFANKQDKFDVIATQTLVEIFDMHKIKNREWTVLPSTAST